MKKSTVLIRGALTLTGFAHQTAPERDKREGNKSLQMKTSVTTSDGMVGQVPFITANSVRGGIRRAAARAVLEALRAKHRQVSRETFLCLVRGSMSRQGLAAGGATFKQQQAGASDPFVGLFGGGPLMFHSRFHMGMDLLPMIQSTRHLMPTDLREECVNLTYTKNGVVMDGFPAMLIEDRLIAPRDDFAAGAGADYVENYAEAYAEHIGNVMSERQAKKTQKAEAKASGQFIAEGDKVKSSSDLSNFAMFEAIVPGTKLAFSARLSDATDAQIGLAIMAIRDWANENSLGGGSSRGLGRFTPALSFIVDGVRKVDRQLLHGEAPWYTLDEACAPYVRAAEEAIADVTPEALAELFPVDILPAGKKGKKAASEAAHA